MSPHYLVKNNESDAACQIVDHTHTTHQPALVRATHLLKLNIAEQTHSI